VTGSCFFTAYKTSWTAGVWFPNGQGIVLCSTRSRPALRATQLPIQWLPGTLYPEVKRPGREADHSSPSSAEVKIVAVIPPFPHTSSWHNV
jgi:hypothetical protein